MIRFRTVKTSILTWAAAMLCATVASAASISMETVQYPNTTIIDDLDPFTFTVGPGGNFIEDYINMTGERFTDFHFTWMPPTVTPPLTDGGSFFGMSSATTTSAHFACGSCGNGILDGGGFVLSVLGFAPGTMFTATPTIDAYCPPIPVPAALPLAMSGLGLFGLLRRRRKTA